jgi:hypothetical protein
VIYNMKIMIIWLEIVGVKVYQGYRLEIMG